MNCSFLDLIVENDELFKSFTDTEDELTTFLIAEKGVRAVFLKKAAKLVKSERKHQKGMIERISQDLSSSTLSDAEKFSSVVEYSRKESYVRKINAQEILRLCESEDTRRSVASISFIALLNSRDMRMQNESLYPKFPKDYQKELEFSKINKPKISR